MVQDSEHMGLKDMSELLGQQVSFMDKYQFRRKELALI